jgi:hypothetical protein
MKKRWFAAVLTVVWLAVAGVCTWAELAYYRIPASERLYSPLRDTFGPAGTVGQGLGILGTLMILLGVILYGARKRIRWLGRVGTLAGWLQFHIFLCTLGPYLVLLHTTFKFGGVVSIAFWSMTAVVLSGVFGRYVYARIPKTLQGRFLDRAELKARRDELLADIREIAGEVGGALEPALAGAGAGGRTSGRAGNALFTALRHDMVRRRETRRALDRLSGAGIPPYKVQHLKSLVRDEQKIDFQVRVLDPFQRMFRYWHAFHLPLAILMFVILGVHVTVAIMFGYTWIF